MAGRVYIPSAQAFGTVTGSHRHGILSSMVFLHVSLERGGQVAVLEDDVAPADNVAVFPLRNLRRIPITTSRDPGPGPSAA